MDLAKFEPQQDVLRLFLSPALSDHVKYLYIQAGASLASGDKRVYFVYRGDGKRAQMSTSTWNGSTWASTVNEYFLWADGKIIQKRVGATDSTTRTHYYDQGETRHTGTGTRSKHYYTKDHLGTIHGITSGTGTVEASFRYDPYGLRTDILSGGSTPSDRGYTGHWYFKPSTAAKAAAKEMYLTWYRMYDPVHGRWLSRDPIGENGGLNLYGYVGNGPTNAIDPYGLYRKEGESFKECMGRCRAEQGMLREIADSVGYYGVGAAIVGATVAGVSTGVDAVARRAQDNSMFAGANYKGNSVYGRNAAAARGSSLGRSLGRLRGLLGVASKASGVIGIIATAGSLIGEADCRAKCKDPCDDSSRCL